MRPGEVVTVGYRCIRFNGSQSFGMVAYDHIGRLTRCDYVCSSNAMFNIRGQSYRLKELEKLIR